MRVRIVKTASGHHAVQVVSKRLGKLTIHNHIGTYKNEEKKQKLLLKAKYFIETHDNIQQELFINSPPGFTFSDLKITSSQPLFLYRLLCGIYDKLGLNNFPDLIIKDLVIARIYSPVSKRETVDILTDSFGKNYSLKTVYRHLKQGVSRGLKEIYQTALIEFVKKDMKDPLRLVFYDVTTLFFESTVKDGIRDFGFSKENRFSQTQVVVGLVVNTQGFPLYFDIFTGKTFEGHTFIPVVENIKKTLGEQELVVVADAAMISFSNMESLDLKGIGFIVGARLANIPLSMQKTVSRVLCREDLKTMETKYKNYRLICQYSTNRAAKDKSDREKQIEKVKKALSAPSKISQRFRFLKTVKGNYCLNKNLIVEAESREGIKGFITNTKLDTNIIIDRYHDLWTIEKAFRITKGDLEARPIFHHLEQTIKAHLTIVFAGLAMCKYLEIQTGLSIKRILKIAQKVLTHRVTNMKTGETGCIETTVENPILCGQLKRIRDLGH